MFSFKRRLEYFISSVFSPAVTLVVLSWCCFWISRYAVPARVSLGITTILTAIVLFGSVNEAMPPVSYSKAQDYFLLVSFGFIFLSFLEFVIVLNTDPDPRWLQWLRRCFNIESNKVFITMSNYNLKRRDLFENCHKDINSSCSNLIYVAHITTLSAVHIKFGCHLSNDCVTLLHIAYHIYVISYHIIYISCHIITSHNISYHIIPYHTRFPLTIT